MVCNKTKIRIIGISALVLGLYCLQMSHNEYISKQCQLSSMQSDNIDTIVKIMRMT
jgi:hypothetical protein